METGLIKKQGSDQLAICRQRKKTFIGVRHLPSLPQMLMFLAICGYHATRDQSSNPYPQPTSDLCTMKVFYVYFGSDLSAEFNTSQQPVGHFTLVFQRRLKFNMRNTELYILCVCCPSSSTSCILISGTDALFPDLEALPHLSHFSFTQVLLRYLHLPTESTLTFPFAPSPPHSRIDHSIPVLLHSIWLILL